MRRWRLLSCHSALHRELSGPVDQEWCGGVDRRGIGRRCGDRADLRSVGSLCGTARVRGAVRSAERRSVDRVDRDFPLRGGAGRNLMGDQDASRQSAVLVAVCVVSPPGLPFVAVHASSRFSLLDATPHRVQTICRGSFVKLDRRHAVIRCTCLKSRPRPGRWRCSTKPWLTWVGQRLRCGHLDGSVQGQALQPPVICRVTRIDDEVPSIIDVS